MIRIQGVVDLYLRPSRKHRQGNPASIREIAGGDLAELVEIPKCTAGRKFVCCKDHARTSLNKQALRQRAKNPI